MLKEWPKTLLTSDMPSDAVASHVVMVGRKSKTEVLQHLVQAEHDFIAEPHGQVLLRKDSYSTDSIYIDYELHACDSSREDRPGPTVTRFANWMDSTKGPFTRSRVGNLLCGRAIAPIANVVCYFASDFGGVKSVAALLAAQVQGCPPSDVPFECLPRILIVVDTVAKRFDAEAAKEVVLEAMCTAAGSSELDVAVALRMHYHSLQVVGLQRNRSSRERSLSVHHRLQQMQVEAMASKNACGYLFSHAHACTFAGRLLDNFCSGFEHPFSFVKNSRAVDFSLHDFTSHLSELFAILPAEIWFWHLACPLITSAIIFSAYPRGSHSTYTSHKAHGLANEPPSIPGKPHLQSTL